MPGGAGSEPISDDEFLYRRISTKADYYDPKRSPPLSKAAFTPNKNDVEGISLTRSKYATVEEAAVGKPSCRYYVAVIKAIKIQGEGMEILQDPLLAKPGHARSPQLNW